jgi:hypothetical protein
MSGNEGRRFNDIQRAIQISDFYDAVATEAAKRKATGKAPIAGEETGRTTQLLADRAGCSRSLMERIVELKKKSPPLLNAVWLGLLSLDRALKLARLQDPQHLEQVIAAIEAKDKELLKRLIQIKLCDRFDIPIPDRLVPVFQAAEELDAISGKLSRLGKKLAHDSIGPGLQRVSEMLKEVMPHCVCNACNGSFEDCTACDGKGWLTVSQYFNLQGAMQEAYRRRGTA